MRYAGLVFTLVLVLAVSAISHQSHSKMKVFQERAHKEHWTFSFKEYKHQHHTGLIKKKKRLSVFKKSTKVFKAVQIPNQLDLRGKLSPVLDQGECGSCYAHAIASTMSDLFILKGKPIGTVSPQYIVDCAEEAQGCNGGYFDAAESLELPMGGPSLLGYPYVGVQQPCKKDPFIGHISSWAQFSNGLFGSKPPSIEQIESYMTSQNAPIMAVVDAQDGPWMNYSGGVYNACTLGDVDHMIQIVGWDNEGFVFNRHGNLPPGEGIWIVRNSWGQNWGEQGFIRMKMTDSNGNLCNNIAEEAAYLEM